MKRFFLVLPFFAVLLTISAGNVPTDSLRFELGADHRAYVLCSLNDSKPLRFLLDTGATDLVVNSNGSGMNAANAFTDSTLNTGASGSNWVKRSLGNRLKLGDSFFTDLPLVAIPYPPDFWDGVCGLSVLKQRIFRIDYEKRMIYFYQSYEPSAHSLRLKISYVEGVPVVPVEISVNGKKKRVLVEVDTGSDRVLDLNTPFVEKNELRKGQRPFAISHIASSDPNAGVLENIRFDYLKIGSLVLPNLPGALSTLKEGIQSSDKMDGVMGNNLLKRFQQTYDFGKGYLYLEPNDLLYSKFYGFLVGESN